MRRVVTVLLEDETFRGTAEEIVAQMVSSSPFRWKETPEEYMKGYARRSAIEGRGGISCSDPESFISSLVLAGIASSIPS